MCLSILQKTGFPPISLFFYIHSWLNAPGNSRRGAALQGILSDQRRTSMHPFGFEHTARMSRGSEHANWDDQRRGFSVFSKRYFYE